MTGWIKHDGKGCPLPNGTPVHVILADGQEHIGFVCRSDEPVNVWHWADCDYYAVPEWRLTHYRILRNVTTEIVETENEHQD